MKRSILALFIVTLSMTAFTERLKADPAATTCRSGSSDSAISACTRVISTDRSAAWAYHQRGIALREKGRLEKAIADFTEAIKHDSGFAAAYADRGVAWSRKGRYDQAIVDYEKAMGLDPQLALAFTGRGYAWHQKGFYGKAIGDYEKAISLDPSFAQAYNGRGYARQAQGDLRKALEDYQEALRLDPSYAVAQTNLKKVLSLIDSRPDYQVQAQPPKVTQQQPSIAQTSPLGNRVALIIGNASYRHAPILQNPTRDAGLVARTLEGVGFQTIVVRTDLTREATIQALRDFTAVADGADLAMIYYSGHGIELGGVNYIIPVDAELKIDRNIDIETVNIGQVLNTIEGAKRLRVVILDACRDNPFASQMKRTLATRSLGRGLARIEPEAGTLVVYAAKHGEVALDGDGENSPFAEALVNRIQQTPQLEVRRLFDVVRDDVVASTGKKQQPFAYGSVSGSEDFYFSR